MRRRDFLKAGAAGTAAVAVGAGVLPRLARATVSPLALIAEQVNKSMTGGGPSIPVWQLRDASGTPSPGPGAVPSQIVATAGEMVSVDVTNTLDRSISFHVPGITVSPTTATAPGNTTTYSFTVSTAGSYVFYCNSEGAGDAPEVGRAMGLAGPLIVQPASPANFTEEFTLFFQELDQDLNDAVGAGGTLSPIDFEGYSPNYFFINGLSYPDTIKDSATRPVFYPDSYVLIRFISGGLLYSPMHFHGYHCRVLARDRVAETRVVEKDTVLVAAAECVDVSLGAAGGTETLQDGTFPLHTHFVPAVTADGLYLNDSGTKRGGAITLIGTGIFADGFESGNTSAWSATVSA